MAAIINSGRSGYIVLAGGFLLIAAGRDSRKSIYSTAAFDSWRSLARRHFQPNLTYYPFPLRPQSRQRLRPKLSLFAPIGEIYHRNHMQ